MWGASLKAPKKGDETRGRTGTHAPLLLFHDGRALVLQNLLVRVNADHKVVAHLLRLAEHVGVAKVHHVKAGGRGKRAVEVHISLIKAIDQCRQRGNGRVTQLTRKEKGREREREREREERTRFSFFFSIHTQSPTALSLLTLRNG